MSSTTRRTSGLFAGGYSFRQTGAIGSQIFQAAFIVITSVAIFWLVWLYGSSLRDPRYLDGWLLAVCMIVQVMFHVRRKSTNLTPKASKTWRRVHVFLGYVIIAIFIFHSDFGFPDTEFEWALWTCTVLILISGVFGTYLSWAVQAKALAGDDIAYDRIPKRRAELAREIHALATAAETGPALALPTAPYNDWILDFYTTKLRGFFQSHLNFAAHLVGSQRHMKQLMGEFESLERYVGKSGQEKLREMKALVQEKDRLDFARVQMGLSKAWLFIHIPVTYSLIVLTVLHVVVVYSFSSGVW